MKRLLAIFFCLIVGAGLVFFGIAQNKNYKTEYLRIHIRANSNSYIDQNIKYKIKDEIVEFLTPIISTCSTKEEFQNCLEENLYNIECIANKILAQNSFDYRSQASIKNEYFPTRSYEQLVLEDGFYDALIVSLGTGTGDNWWCVVYPPLCFVNSSYVYKSRFLEIINKFFGG